MGQLASTVGVSTDTIRLREGRGLLRAKGATNGYRIFDHSVVETARTITLA